MTKEQSQSIGSLDGAEPIFVCGALRSGTTLLRLMIDHHPDVSNPGEMDFLFECPKDTVGQYDLAAYHRYLKLNRIFLNTKLSIDETLDHDELIRSFVDGVRSRGKILTINLHRHFDRVPEVFPNAQFIHLLRDPRDVANSSIGMGWAGNAYFGVDHWIESELAFARLREKVGARQVISVTNEDLILENQRVLSQIAEFIGVSYDSAMLDYAKHSTYSTPDPSLVQQWKKKSSKRDLALVEGKVGAMLAERGYGPSGVEVKIPSKLEEIQLKLQHRLGRLRFSIRRNGAVLTMLNLISNRIPIPGLRRFVQIRMNRITQRHLK